MEKMAICCQNLTLGAVSSCSAFSMLVGALFKKFGLLLNTPRILAQFSLEWEMFQTKVLDKIRTHFFMSHSFSPKIVPFMR
jgi:hypothetical protein